MIILSVTDIEWDAPKSVKGDLPNSFVFHIDEDEGNNFDDEEDIHEWVSDKLSDETGYCHFGFCFQQIVAVHDVDEHLGYIDDNQKQELAYVYG